jgi:tRNA threonylcarbamoyl adenosine modification protein YeaZ
MLVLAIDTATPAVTAGLVSVPELRLVDERITVDARAHAELLAPAIRELLDAHGRPGAIVCGIGPGPFTGLRIGMVTAAALGDGLDVPVHGVCSLDAIAFDARAPQRLLVATDARRREVYWALYQGGHRVEGPHVQRPAELAGRLPELGATAAAGAGAALYADVLGLPVLEPHHPSPLALVAVADLDRQPEPLQPLYLRRPDAVPSGTRR